MTEESVRKEITVMILFGRKTSSNIKFAKVYKWVELSFEIFKKNYNDQQIEVVDKTSVDLKQSSLQWR